MKTVVHQEEEVVVVEVQVLELELAKLDEEEQLDEVHLHWEVDLLEQREKVVK